MSGILKTPLYQHFIDCSSQYASADAKPETEQDGHDTIVTFNAKRGISIEYRQTFLTERSYRETITIRKGDIAVARGNIVEERRDGLYIDSVDPDEKISPQDLKYSAPLHLIPDIMRDLLSQYIDQVYADQFAQSFIPRFERIKDLGCDYIYLLNTKDMICLGDRNFVDIVKESPDLKEGLKQAYMLYRKRYMSHQNVENFEEALSQFPADSSIALFTNEQHAMRIMGAALFDVDSFIDNRFDVGNLEFRIDNHQKYIESFFDGILSTNIYDLLSKLFQTDKDSIKQSISMAENSKSVRGREQMAGIVKALAAQKGRSIEEALGIEVAEYYGDINIEMGTLTHDIMIYDEYVWWKKVKESVGMIFSGTLDDRLQESRQPDWRRRTIDAYKRFGSTLKTLDYRMFLQISPEREPTSDGGAWVAKRFGVGNMIIDFGNRELLDMLNLSSNSIDADMGSIYDNHRRELSAYLFRGKMLKLVLDRILPKYGGIVAVDTTPARVNELATFCNPKEGQNAQDKHTICYKNVDLVLVNDEARAALEAVRKNKQHR